MTTTVFQFSWNLLRTEMFSMDFTCSYSKSKNPALTIYATPRCCPVFLSISALLSCPIAPLCELADPVFLDILGEPLTEKHIGWKNCSGIQGITERVVDGVSKKHKALVATAQKIV